MKLLDRDHSMLMDISLIEREGSTLVIRGTIMGAMPVQAVLTPSEARSALRQLGFRGLMFVFTLLFRS